VRSAGLRARHEALTRQIAEAERGLRLGRRDAASLDYLRNQVMVRLEVFKTTSTQAAALSLQAVSGEDRLSVIDTARAPLAAQPGRAMLAAASVFVTLFALASLLIVEYVVGFRAGQRLRRRLSDVAAPRAAAGAEAGAAA
jgi:hypothetical protein